MTNRSAILIGATGLVGGHCLRLLLSDEGYDRVIALGRRTLKIEHPRLEQHIVDFERLADHAVLLKAHDVFCCLGTMIRKAGSHEAFWRVDFTYQYEVAKLAASNGAEQLLLVSSLGANARSRIFYSRVKGELEEAVGELTFSAVNIFRPSLLLGERAELRFGEQVAERLLRYSSFLLAGPLSKYRPVPAATIAAAMVRVAKEGRRGIHIIESDAIETLGAPAIDSWDGN
jgi:uncharacterized protein YbjT (DUF2867 family)